MFILDHRIVKNKYITINASIRADKYKYIAIAVLPYFAVSNFSGYLFFVNRYHLNNKFYYYIIFHQLCVIVCISYQICIFTLSGVNY